MEKVTNELQQQLANGGFRSSIVSIQHLPDLQYDLGHFLEQGILSRDFYNEIVSRYDLDYHFEPPADFPTAQSIIITAAPQPKVSVKFGLSGEVYSSILPPIYIHDTDERASNIISRYLLHKGYRARDAILPEKPLAVHCGLATYGKNNISYIDGLGSFFRLRVFFADIPCTSDIWRELKMMDRCKKCVVCIKRCPTNAITKDRFLIDAPRCLTYFNEGKDEFPKWIDPAWHNCLMGCMICQDICPVNKEYKNWIAKGEEFSEEETLMILKGVSRDKLPPETLEKLRKLYLLDDYYLLQRNLGVLVSKI